MFELDLLIITPFLLGFVGERFKDMQTWRYVLIIFFLFCGIEFYYSVSLGSKIFGDLFCNILYFIGLIVSTSVFYFQKYWRKREKRAQRN